MKGMRILVFGAGVLGGNLATNLFRSHKDVTLLARGVWGDHIQQNGLAIHHYFGKKTVSKIPVVSSLAPDDCYDVIFAVVRYSQLDSIVPVLRENASKNIVFVGNNLHPEELATKLPEKNVLFAFASSAGHRESDHIESIDIRKITIGQLKGSPSNEQLIHAIFDGTKYRVTYEPNMGDWLLCHAASVLPIAFACYHTHGDLRKIKSDKAYLNRVMDATIAAYRVLERNGHEILPKSDQGYEKPGFKRLYLPFYRLICATRLGKLCTSDHAMNAIDEMSAMNRDFKQVLRRYGEIPGAWTSLERDTNGYLEP